MATTSIWSVKGWLGKVVIYVENPEKTTAPEIAKFPRYENEGAVQREEKMQSLSDVIAYAVNAEKTRRKGKKGEEGTMQKRPDGKGKRERRGSSVRRSRSCSSMFPGSTARPPPRVMK